MIIDKFGYILVDLGSIWYIWAKMTKWSPNPPINIRIYPKFVKITYFSLNQTMKEIQMIFVLIKLENSPFQILKLLYDQFKKNITKNLIVLKQI